MSFLGTFWESSHTLTLEVQSTKQRGGTSLGWSIFQGFLILPIGKPFGRLGLPEPSQFFLCFGDVGRAVWLTWPKSGFFCRFPIWMQERLAVNLCYSSDPLQASALGLSAWVGVGWGVGCRGGRCQSAFGRKNVFFLGKYFSGVGVKERFLTLERCP